MKHLRLFLILLAGLTAVYGQDGPPPEDGPRDDRPESNRPKLLEELGLSPDQIQQIRRMNQARRPIMMEAQRRMREANRDLDMAIYGDAISDAEFQARLKDFQSAQAELARLRFESELSVRKVLTPEQLVRFRQLRRRFAEMRNNNVQDRRMRRRGQGGPPMRDVPQQRPIN